MTANDPHSVDYTDHAAHPGADRAPSAGGPADAASDVTALLQKAQAEHYNYTAFAGNHSIRKY